MGNREFLNSSCMRELLEKHPLSEELQERYEASLMRIYESRKLCEGCRGLYMCPQARPGERLSFSYDGVLLREVEHCPYEKERQRQEDLSSSYVYSDIPEQLLTLDLSNIELEDNALKQLYVLIYDIYEGKRDRGLYICGDLGVGKTYMSVALANSLVKKGVKTAFVKTADFINDMRRAVVNDTARYDAVIRSLMEAEVLILDDLGSESVSSFSRDDVLFPILDYRLENKMMTLFTSNLTKTDLLRYYMYDKSDKAQALRARRLVERIDILSDEYVLQGRNKRRPL